MEIELEQRILSKLSDPEDLLAYERRKENKRFQTEERRRWDKANPKRLIPPLTRKELEETELYETPDQRRQRLQDILDAERPLDLTQEENEG